MLLLEEEKGRSQLAKLEEKLAAEAATWQRDRAQLEASKNEQLESNRAQRQQLSERLAILTADLQQATAAANECKALRTENDQLRQEVEILKKEKKTLSHFGSMQSPLQTTITLSHATPSKRPAVEAEESALRQAKTEIAILRENILNLTRKQQEAATDTKKV